MPHLAVLRDAVWQDRRVRLRYRNFDGKASQLAVDPYGLVIGEGAPQKGRKQDADDRLRA